MLFHCECLSKASGRMSLGPPEEEEFPVKKMLSVCTDSRLIRTSGNTSSLLFLPYAYQHFSGNRKNAKKKWTANNLKFVNGSNEGM